MVDRRLLRFDVPVWIGVYFAVVDRHLGRSLIGVWFADRRLVRRCDRRLACGSLSLAECVLFAAFFLSVALSLFLLRV